MNVSTEENLPVGQSSAPHPAALSDSAPASPPATVVITTKNRVEDLRVAVRSALAQTVPIEVLVLDDGSTDHTSEIIAREFPTVRLIREETSRGLIVRRNQAARLARGPIIISIDDDAAFPSTSTIETTLREFDSPRIGAVAIPFVNFNQDLFVRQRAPSPDQVYVTRSFIGTAHALRRDVFLGVGGYREYLFHQGEEGDLCVRLLDAGYIVRLGIADPIHHFESPRRDFRRMDLYGRRNDILFAWYNVPMPYLLLHLIATTFNGIQRGLLSHRFLRMGQGLIQGYRHILRQWKSRAPVARHTYVLYRRIPSEASLALCEVESVLPRLVPISELKSVRQG